MYRIFVIYWLQYSKKMNDGVEVPINIMQIYIYILRV